MPDLTLKDKTIKGMAWNAFEKFGVYAISFIIGIILARILMPSDYGLIGMLAIFFAFSDLFVRSGFSETLIQKKDRTEVDYSTIFYFNLIVAIIFYVALFFSAPLIAVFYEVPQLTLLTRVLSFNIILNSLALVQQTRLTINLDFKTQAIVSLFSVIISGPVGIYFAYHGLGVWALVIQSISSSVIRTSLLYYHNKWLPLLTFSFSSFKQLFGFSSKLLGAGFLATFFNNIYSLVIGKVFAARDLGFYTRARQYPELLSNTITSVLQGVSFPVLASLQDDKERMISIYGRLMRVVVFFVIPSLTLLALLSGPFIRLLLTDKWAPAIPLLQWLCFARMITPISALNMNILNAIGRSDLFLKVDLTKLPLAIAVLIITIPFGLKAIVIGNFVLTFINFFINTYYPGKLFGFGAVRQVKEMFMVIIATLIMSGCVLGLMMILPTPLAVTIYLLAAYFLRIEEIKEVFKIAHSFYGKSTA